MPLRLPDKLPAVDILKKENIFVMNESRAHTQMVRPLKIVVLNLMPLKITTETEAAGRTVKASKDEPQYRVTSDKSGRDAVHKPESLKKRSS